MNKLIANQNAYQTLAASLRGGRLSHALLVEGPAGCGKTVFAREVAQAALCSAGDSQRPCLVCRDCIKAEKDIHPDILLFGGEGGSRSFHIDQVRALRQQAFVRPNEASCKALLLRNVHEMSVQAQNALLKIIEEPPRGVLFVLTVENRFSLLETIRSRVQVIPLQLPSAEECARHLLSLDSQLEQGRAHAAAVQAGGNIGRALRLLDDAAESGDESVEILYNACVGSELDALAALAKYERNRQGLAALLSRMGAALGSALVRPPQEGLLADLTGRVDQLRLMQILAIIEDMAQAVSQNVGGLLLTTSLCAKIRSVLTVD